MALTLTPVTMTQAKERLDALDGKVDNRYLFLIPLEDEDNAVGACLAAEKGKGHGDKSPLKARFRNSHGENVEVDCARTAHELKLLAEISEKVSPITKTFVARVAAGEGIQESELPSAEEFFSSSIIGRMIIARFEGSGDTLAQSFNALSLGCICHEVTAFEKYRNFHMDNVRAAYSVFAKILQQHGLNPTPFEPPPPRPKDLLGLFITDMRFRQFLRSSLHFCETGSKPQGIATVPWGMEGNYALMLVNPDRSEAFTVYEDGQVVLERMSFGCSGEYPSHEIFALDFDGDGKLGRKKDIRNRQSDYDAVLKWVMDFANNPGGQQVQNCRPCPHTK